jgi:hypothetical protein
MGNPSRLGANLGGADANENFLKVFAGEVLATFQETNLFLSRTLTRTISTGKSAAFPVIGTAAAHWHTPGESVIIDQAAAGTQSPANPAAADYLSIIKSTEREIFIDDALVSSVLVDDLDAMKVHWDHRSHYSSGIGRALALECDKHIMSTILAATRAAENITSVTGVNADETVAAPDSADNMIEAIYNMAGKFDDNNVTGDRYVAVRPAMYYTLSKKTDVVNRDYTSGNGDMADGTVFKIAGFTLVKTANMPADDADESGIQDTGAKNDPHAASGEGYNTNWSGVRALCWTPEAVGTVKMADIQVMQEYQTERLAHLLLARYAMGHNYLRPECSGLIKDA